MATIANPPSDPVPLLGDSNVGRGLRRAAQFLRQASNRRMVRAPSLFPRDGDQAFSGPVLVLDVLWNLAFVTVAASVLILSLNESPVVPLRAWVMGYMMQSALHIVCVCMGYQKRGGWTSDAEAGVFHRDNGQDGENLSTAKHLESAITMFSFIWWIIGFYWVSAGGQALIHDSPRLYWFCSN